MRLGISTQCEMHVKLYANLVDVLQGVFIHAVVDQVDRLVLCLFTFFEDLKHLASKSFFFCALFLFDFEFEEE